MFVCGIGVLASEVDVLPFLSYSVPSNSVIEVFGAEESSLHFLFRAWMLSVAALG